MKVARNALAAFLLLLPSAVAAELSPRQATVLESAIQRALETKESGDRQDWALGDGLRGYAMPVRTWRSVSGTFCRVFQVWKISGDEKVQTQDGIRCRNEEGHWIEPEMGG